MDSAVAHLSDAPPDNGKKYDEDICSHSSQSPIVFTKQGDGQSIVRRTAEQELDRRTTHIQDVSTRQRTPLTSCVVPNGLASQLFAPLWMAVFHPKKLQKRIIAAVDIERLCIALLKAAKVDERPFLTVGSHIKGLCLILLQKLQSLFDDAAGLSRKMMLTKSAPAISGRPKQRKTYEDMDEDYQLPKRKRSTGKSHKTKKRMLALVDYFDSAHEMSSEHNDSLPHGEDSGKGSSPGHDGDYMPVEQLEVLQLMNFGIGMGMGTDLAFYSASDSKGEHGISYHNFEHGIIDRQPMALDIIRQNRETINPDMYMDLQALSSPFKLNGYSFSPQTRLSQEFSDAATTIASTELSLQTDSVMLSTPEFGKYDLDWDIYNDALKEIEDPLASQNRSSSNSITPSNGRRLVLEYVEPDGKPVHLVKSKSVAKYDTKVTNKVVKATRKTKLQQDEPVAQALAVVPRPPTDKAQWFDSAIDTLVQSVIGNMPVDNQDQTTVKRAASRDKQTKVVLNPQVQVPTSKQAEKWFKSVDNEVTKAKKAQIVREAFGSDSYSTINVLEGYRKYVRQLQDPTQPIEFSSLVHGRSRVTASHIFYRTLCLANADYIGLSQQCYPGAGITVTPARRFWEPVPQYRDTQA